MVSGVGEDLVRLSVGLEDVNDLIADLRQSPSWYSVLNAVALFIDCQPDDVFGVDAAGLLHSITLSLLASKHPAALTPRWMRAFLPHHLPRPRVNSRQHSVTRSIRPHRSPRLDEIDYVTPRDGGGEQWRAGSSSSGATFGRPTMRPLAVSDECRC
ncbi:PLP-dependent transferase [Sinorhizobium garamanticum]|uniref:PLP-dependent transferase n=1 Tax=Sinorhizobium garamanticum TaxID=680247 RepID=UPI00314545DA